MCVGRFVKTWTIALIGVLLIAVSPIRGISVLCISELGHLEIEVAGSSCCEQAATPSEPTAPLVAESADDCGSCVDVIFAQNIARIVHGIQVAPNDRAPSGPVPNAIFLSPTPIGDQVSQQTIPLFGLISSPVVPSRFPTVIRC